ncbi:MAG TPA: hypothetical protein VJT15_08700 [Pyrinomonadaceae bacterium]|nr:hypothetical protein [Pyrinomonadaceae bacterium]
MARKPRPVLPPDYWKPKNAKEGQPRINAQLVNVDQMIIEALQDLTAMVSALVPASARTDNLRVIKDTLKEADETSIKIAHIEPPGCDPRYPPDSKPKTTAS